MSIVDFIDHSIRAATPYELFNRLVETASVLGFDYIAYASLEGIGRWGREAASGPAIMLNYPASWEKHYRANEYHRIDPVFQYAHVAGRPFFWADLRRLMTLSPEQEKLLDEATSAGLLDGVCVPLYGPKGGVALISFAGSKPNPQANGTLGHLNMLAAQFHLAYMKFAPPEVVPDKSPPITRRERECLRWIAQGKSSADIAAILGISENTVNFHIKKLLGKLEVHSRTVAVLRAQTMGLLD
ncbi:MAG TPA: LuxR family transcriptional regulator [Pedomonas sp.]|uniref:LuxR family transcriptional regulator n=1 Tax=Pedomonas sp. TaxID=2976421 RepID=UPI002F3FBB6A